MINNRLTMPSILLLSLLALSACEKPSTTESSAEKATEKATETETEILNNDVIKTEAELSGKSEVLPTDSKGEGDVELHIDQKNNKVTWEIEYEDLTGPVTKAHFHGPAMASEKADVALPIEGNLTSPIKGEATLTAAQMADLLAGKWYVNLHTAAHPDGEIRAQIEPKP